MLRGVEGHLTWVDARATNDFSSFLPVLERNLELRRRYVECFEWDDSPYTALLDDFEPFMTTTEVAEMFDTVQPVLLELVRRPRRRRRLPRGSIPRAPPARVRPRVAATLGFEEGAWRLDPDGSPVLQLLLEPGHPALDPLPRDRPRLVLVDDARGRARPVRARHRPLARADAARHRPVPGLNESQSRTWENLVARSRPFWAHWYEPLQDDVPGAARRRRPRRLPRGVNRAEPGLIRIEADETTYSLHVILGSTSSGSCSTERSRRRLAGGVERRHGGAPRCGRPDDARGVLQDVHWSWGGFGYFPTYALGNDLAPDLVGRARGHPDLDGQLEAGEIEELSAWLRDNLYSLGRKLTPKETIERITGSPTIDPQRLAYLREKASTSPSTIRAGRVGYCPFRVSAPKSIEPSRRPCDASRLKLSSAAVIQASPTAASSDA